MKEQDGAAIARGCQISFDNDLSAPEETTAYPYSTDNALQRLLERYRRSCRPIKFSFRDAVHWLRVSERATHYLHPYPGKLLPHIAHFFLSAESLSSVGDLVLDPFGGSGTVGLEALLARRRPVLADSNPLARLISACKTTVVPSAHLRHRSRLLADRIKAAPTRGTPSVVNLRQWFTPAVIRQLNAVLHAIEQEPDGSVRSLFLTSFSVAVRKVSLADPKLSVPVRLKSQAGSTRDPKRGEATRRRSPPVRRTFFKVLERNIARLEELERLVGTASYPALILNDARSLTADGPASVYGTSTPALKPSSVQLIITSPPYGGAQKYIRSSSLSLGWLRLAKADQLRALEDESIGREHHRVSSYATPLRTGLVAADRRIDQIRRINPLRAHIVATYLIEMRQAIAEMAKVLRPGGHLIMIIGNNDVCGRPFLTSKYLTDIILLEGLHLRLRLVDDIRSRGLMTKRNKTASVITREWVLVFCKPSVWKSTCGTN